jgi:hypothetical protein
MLTAAAAPTGIATATAVALGPPAPRTPPPVRRDRGAAAEAQSPAGGTPVREANARGRYTARASQANPPQRRPPAPSRSEPAAAAGPYVSPIRALAYGGEDSDDGDL